jgi:hypothetical protein
VAAESFHTLALCKQRCSVFLQLHAEVPIPAGV